MKVTKEKKTKQLLISQGIVALYFIVCLAG
jgi:hypothetical protein